MGSDHPTDHKLDNLHQDNTQPEASTSALTLEDKNSNGHAISETQTPSQFEPGKPPELSWGLADYGLPPRSNSIPPNATVDAKLRHFHSLRSQNVYFNASLQANKSFRNPAILSKLVDFVAVDDKLSAFPKEVWTSSAGLGPNSWALTIAEKQKQLSEERQRAQERGKRANIEFAPSSKERVRTQDRHHSSSASRDGEERKRSRWDKDNHNRSSGVLDSRRKEGSKYRNRSRSPVRWR